MKEIVFKLKNGDVSAYGFKCGHVQTFEESADHLPRNHEVELYQEHEVYHVRLLMGDRYAFPWDSSERKQWKSFGTLKEARKQYRDFVRFIQNEVKANEVPTLEKVPHALTFGSSDEVLAADQLHDKIMSERPATEARLHEIAAENGLKIRVVPVFFYGYKQGVKIRLGRYTRPKKDIVYSIFHA